MLCVGCCKGKASKRLRKPPSDHQATANTAERRLSSDCGPATPWWVWGVPHAARARAAQRQTERKHSRLRGAGEDRAASATRSARERASPISIVYRPFQNSFSLVSIPYVPSTFRARAVRDPGSITIWECSDGTHLSYKNKLQPDRTFQHIGYSSSDPAFLSSPETHAHRQATWHFVLLASCLS